MKSKEKNNLIELAISIVIIKKLLKLKLINEQQYKFLERNFYNDVIKKYKN